MTTAVVVGNPRPASRTWQAAHRVASALTGTEAELDLDLATFGPSLLDRSSENVAAAVEQVKVAELVVVASPTYKGAYTGLLKLFLDRFGTGALAGARAVPVMLGGDLRHALAPEVFLKPVLVEIGLSCPTAGLFLVDSEWDAPTALDAWLPAARAVLS